MSKSNTTAVINEFERINIPNRLQPPSKPPPSIRLFQESQNKANNLKDGDFKLKRSVSFGGKNNRVCLKNRVTFRVEATPLQSVGDQSNLNQPNLQKVNSASMTSEDLLQPGHVVKERWKVCSKVKIDVIFVKNIV